MNTPSPSSTSAQLLSALAVAPEEEVASSRSILDAPRREASRDKGARTATDLYRAVRQRPELAAGAVAAVAIAAGALLWSQYGRGLLAVGSGYAVERFFGRGRKRRATRLVARVGRLTHQR